MLSSMYICLKAIIIKSTVQCTVLLYSLLIDYLMADFKHSLIRQLGAKISLLCLNAHCVKFLCTTSDLDCWDWVLWKNVLACSDRTTGSWETARLSLCGGGGWVVVVWGQTLLQVVALLLLLLLRPCQLNKIGKI